MLYVLFPCRYGIPVNFASFVMVHKPKTDRRVHDYLCTTFGHADDRYLEAEVGTGLNIYFVCLNHLLTQKAVELPAGLGFTQADYRPYVFFPVNLNLLEK